MALLNSLNSQTQKLGKQILQYSSSERAVVKETRKRHFPSWTNMALLNSALNSQSQKLGKQILHYSSSERAVVNILPLMLV